MPATTGADTPPGRLRRRLLVSFLLVSLAPVVLLTVIATRLLTRRLDDAQSRRTEAALAAVTERVTDLGVRARLQLASVASGLRGSPATENPQAFAEKAAGFGFDVFDVVDSDGRILASLHWPAAVGLPEADEPLSTLVRLEPIGEGHGMARRLAVVSSHATTWRGSPVTLRGGFLVDGRWLGELSQLLGTEVGFFDKSRGRLTARPDSPLSGWVPPESSPGIAILEGTHYRWATRSLGSRLWIVAATPQAEAEALTAAVYRWAMITAALAAAAGLLAAVALSGRIAGPVRDLAQGARRVASGDLTSAVALDSNDELGELARTFNAMTAELRHSRARLVQTERVAAWRDMARRLAHELKNPLFPIQLSIETLRRALDRDPGGPEASRDFLRLFRESSQTILDEIRRLRGIIEEFGEFARMPTPRLSPVDLNAVVNEVLALYQARAAGLRIETSFSPDLPPASADSDLLARAVGNLVANAIEAMPHGGALRVRTFAHESGVAVEVEDTGPGLTEVQRARLFTPYFTTKRTGTGLGLAIVQGIVSDHGGRIEVNSEPGQGTSVMLLLPSSVPMAGQGKLDDSAVVQLASPMRTKADQ